MNHTSSSNGSQTSGPSRRSSPGDFFFKTPQEYFNMFRERWPLGLIAALVAAGGLLFWESQKPEIYRTEATLLFEPRTDRVVPIEDVVDTSLQAGQLNTHREWLQSKSFYDYVASFFSPEEIEMIQAPYRDPSNPASPPPSLAAIIRPNVSAYIRRNTTIIGITVRHKDPEAAALIADRYARRYIDFNLDRAQTGTQSAIVFLQNQADDLRERVERAERELQEYRGRHNIASLEENQNIVNQRVQRLSGEIVTAQIQRLTLESDRAKIQEYLDEEKDLTAIAYIKEYGNVAALLEQLDNLRSERDRLELEYLRRHPRMLENEQAIQSVRDRLEMNLQRAVSDLVSRHTAAIQHEKRLEEELLQAEKESLSLDRLTVQYRFLEREVDTARNSFSQIVRRLNDANIAAQLELINIRIFDSAWIPLTPVEPNLGKMTVQAALLSFLLLAGIPIGIGLIDTRLKAAWDVEELWGGKPLGEIPKLKGVKKKSRPHVVTEGKDEGACQAFLGLYSQLQIDEQTRHLKCFLVTSTMPQEGKSFVAHNLATTFAQQGRKTLLIDADFRAPSLHTFYGRENREGLLKAFDAPEMLEGDPLDHPLLGVQRPHDNLHIISTGGCTRRPAQILDGPLFAEFLDNCRNRYDVIIIDTPPLGIFPDALLLGSRVDGIFFVCRFNRVSKGRLEVQLDKIRQLRSRFSGIIVNGIPAGSRSTLYNYHGFGSYSAREYKKYYASVE